MAPTMAAAAGRQAPTEAQQPNITGHQPNNDDGGIFINLQVPPGAEAGVDSLTFEYGGNEFDVLVPDGSIPGDVLRIQVQVGSGRVSDECEATNSSDLVEELDGKDDANNTSDVSERESKEQLACDCSDDSSTRQTSSLTETKKRPSLLSELGGVANDENDNITTKRPKNGTDNSMSPPEENITVVSLGDGSTQGSDTSTSLHLYESIENASNNTKDNIAANTVGDGTHGMVWASGIVLAQALTSTIGLEYLTELFRRWNASPPPNECFPNNQSNTVQPHNINCLELGSGLGVCGLALAHALHLLGCHSERKSANHGTTIVLTDQGEASIELLQKNIQRNIPPSFGIRSSDNYDGQFMNIMAAESLVWGEELQSSTTDIKVGDELRFHLILGSDILYNTHESYGPLVNTIQRYLHPKEGTILLAVRWRKPELEREFFRMVEERCKGLKFQLWKEFVDDNDFGGRRCPCVLTWEDYGNPESDLSNSYFHGTTVCIERKRAGSNIVPLANTTERDMELMTDDEYSKFEELQVQIYVGRYRVESRGRRYCKQLITETNRKWEGR